MLLSLIIFIFLSNAVNLWQDKSAFSSNGATLKQERLILLSNAVTLKQNKSILLSRVVIVTLIFSIFIAYNNLMIESLGEGVSIYGDLFYVDHYSISLNIYIFMFFIVLLIFPGFLRYRYKNTINIIFIIPFLIFLLNKYLFVTILNLLGLYWAVLPLISLLSILLYYICNIHNKMLSYKVIVYIIVYTYIIVNLTFLLQQIWINYTDLLETIPTIALLLINYKLDYIHFDEHILLGKIKESYTLYMENTNTVSSNSDSSSTPRGTLHSDLPSLSAPHIPTPSSPAEQPIYNQVCALREHWIKMKESISSLRHIKGTYGVDLLLNKNDDTCVDVRNNMSRREAEQIEDEVYGIVDKYRDYEYNATLAYRDAQKFQSLNNTNYLKKEEFLYRTNVHLTHELYHKLWTRVQE